MGVIGNPSNLPPTTEYATDVILLEFPVMEVMWGLEKELYGQLPEYSELSLDFILRKLELVYKLKIQISE